MSKEADYLHRHGWRISGSEMRKCKKIPLWTKVGVAGEFSTTEAVERQHRGNSPEEIKRAEAAPRYE